MADTVSLDPVASTNLRSVRSSTSNAWTDNWQQAKNENHYIQGFSSSKLSRYNSLIRFDFTGAEMQGVKQILKAELHLFTANDHSGIKTDKVATTLAQLKMGLKRWYWIEAGGGEGVWTGAINDHSTDYNNTYITYAHISEVDLHENVVNLMSLVRAWAPKTIKDQNGKACLGLLNHGAVMTWAGSTAHESVLASADHVNVSIRPFLVLTVVRDLGPGVTLTESPNGDIPVGTKQFFVGSYQPGDPNDNIAVIRVKRMGGGLPDLSWDTTPNSNDVTTSTFSVPVPVSWPLATAFTWDALVKNSKGVWTPHATPVKSVRWMGVPPVLSAPLPSGGTYDSLISVPFRATVNVPLHQYRATRWRVQLRPYLISTDPTWEDGVLWDSGPVTVPLSASEAHAVTAPVKQNLRMAYGGPLLDPGQYSWRVMALDRYGAASPWIYTTVTLAVPKDELEPAPGDLINLTGYAKFPPFRIRIFGMGANRGPGKLLAELVDASNVGASEFYNSGGEFFFTLPVTHPQASVIEPYQTHYALEIHTEKGWRGKAFGLITDFDANENEVVFYGQDYMALLARMMEERFDPTNAELPTDKGGAKYVNHSIGFIISDQLSKAKAMPNSPVGFIVVDTVPTIAEFITIYASFKMRLPFIAGLIDSSKAGTGRKTRLTVVRNPDGSFHWRLLLSPGIQRDNLRLEYGGMVNGFRTVPFSNWGTAVAAVGRTALGTKVYSAIAVAPGIDETRYGHWPTATSYADIDDLNDLRRRTAQAANKIARVGKQMGLALRVDSLGLKDGWDITDSLPVWIKRGVVDTTRMGGIVDPAHPENDRAGNWTIWGWTWNSHPDGHTDLVLTVAPNEDGHPPNPDLIPSKPILNGDEWKVGHGKPTTWNAPPVASDAMLRTALPLDTDLISAEHYEDLNTGCVYHLDTDDTSPTYLTYVEDYCPAAAIPGPPGAPGAPGAPGPAGPPGGRDTTAPEAPNDLALTTGAILQTDGSLRPFIQGNWTPITNAGLDLFGYEVDLVPANPYKPVQGGALGWIAETRSTGVGTLAAASYRVAVTAHGNDGGETGGYVQQIAIAAGQKLWVKTLLASPAAGLTNTHTIYVITSVNGTETPVKFADTTATEIEITALPTGTPPTLPANSTAYAWAGQGLVHLRVKATQFIQNGVLGGWFHAARVVAVDTSNNRSVYGIPPSASVVSATDGTAPDIPANLAAAAGYTLVGLQWGRSASADLDRYQVRWRPFITPTPDWIGPLNVYANFAVISDLDTWLVPPVPLTPTTPEAEGILASYEFAVRAVDRSGNVTLALGDPGYPGIGNVGNVASDGLGWTPSIQAAMSPIPADQIAVNELFANWAYLINLTAEQITAGHLAITPNTTGGPDDITIWADTNQTKLAGYWSPSGWYIVDPNSPGRAIRGKNGILSFTANALTPVWTTPEASWTTAIAPEGITADLITTGSFGGGHNRLLNSGFELRPRSTLASFIFDTIAEFDAPLAGSVNKSTGAAAFQQAKYQYTDV